jgi:hypothetical protein
MSLKFIGGVTKKLGLADRGLKSRAKSKSSSTTNSATTRTTSSVERSRRTGKPVTNLFYFGKLNFVAIRQGYSCLFESHQAV